MKPKYLQIHCNECRDFDCQGHADTFLYVSSKNQCSLGMDTHQGNTWLQKRMFKRQVAAQKRGFSNPLGSPEMWLRELRSELVCAHLGFQLKYSGSLHKGKSGSSVGDSRAVTCSGRRAAVPASSFTFVFAEDSWSLNPWANLTFKAHVLYPVMFL